MDVTYDGQPHAIAVTAPEGATVTYAQSKNGLYVTVEPTFTDVVSTCVWYRVEKSGYNTVTRSVPVTIRPASFAYVLQDVTGEVGGDAGFRVGLFVWEPAVGNSGWDSVTGYSVEYSESANGPWSSDLFYTTVCARKAMYVRLSAPNYATVVDHAYVTVRAADFGNTVSATGVDVTYDGNPHVISVTAPVGATVTYATAESGPYETTNPTFTGMVSTSVWYRVEKSGYNTLTGSVDVVIAPVEFDGELSIRTAQRYPWNGLVDIDVAMSGAIEDRQATLVASNGTTGVGARARSPRRVRWCRSAGATSGRGTRRRP